MAETARQLGQQLDTRPVTAEASDDNPIVRSMAEGYMGAAPLGWRVVVDDLLEEEVAAMGLHIPENTDSAAHRGRIVAAGLMALDVMRSYGIHLGDVVDYGKYSGVWHNIDVEEKVNGTVVRRRKKMLYMSLNDVIGNLSLGERMRENEYVIKRGMAPSGAPMHYLSRKD